MYKNEVFGGPKVTLIDMLEARDNRAQRQRAIYEKYQEGSLLSITLNIPGDIKTSERFQEIFDTLTDDIHHILGKNAIKYSRVDHFPTGSEAYIFTNLESTELKRQMVAFEMGHPYGRIFDLDVLVLEEGQLRDVKRQEVGAEARRCYICDQLAKECARARTHSMDEIRKVITNIILNADK